MALDAVTEARNDFVTGYEATSKALYIKRSEAPEVVDPHRPACIPESLATESSTRTLKRSLHRSAAAPHLSKADKQMFSLRNVELCNIAKELEPARHFLELAPAEQEVIRLLLAERQQITAGLEVTPVANGLENKKSASTAGTVGRSLVREREIQQ